MADCGSHIPGGCILLARSILDSEVWGWPPWQVKLWIYLLLQASHGRRRETDRLERGQLVTNARELSKAASYREGARQRTPSASQITKFLRRLREAGMIEAKTVRGTAATPGASSRTFITILHYGDYQHLAAYGGNAGGNIAYGGNAAATPAATTDGDGSASGDGASGDAEGHGGNAGDRTVATPYIGKNEGKKKREDPSLCATPENADACATDPRALWAVVSKSDDLEQVAWAFALHIAAKAGPLGNPNLHRTALAQWLGPFWSDRKIRLAAIKRLGRAVNSKSFTAELAAAPVWKTILSELGRLRSRDLVDPYEDLEAI